MKGLHSFESDQSDIDVLQPRVVLRMNETGDCLAGRDQPGEVHTLEMGSHLVVFGSREPETLHVGNFGRRIVVRIQATRKNPIRILALVFNFHPDRLDVPAGYINPKDLLALLMAEGDRGHSNLVVGLGLSSFHEGDIRKRDRPKRRTTGEGQDKKDRQENQRNTEECAHVPPSPLRDSVTRDEVSISSAVRHVKRWA